MKILAAYAISPCTLRRFAVAQLVQDSAVLRGVDVWVDFAPDEEYSLAAARNRCSTIAVLGGYDVLLPLDADCVVEQLPREWPLFARALVRDYCGVTDYRPASWWGIRYEVLMDHRWCEEFTGHGYEDNDFVDNVCRGIPKLVLNDFRCRHVPHEQQPKNDRNRLLFEARQH